MNANTITAITPSIADAPAHDSVTVDFDTRGSGLATGYITLKAAGEVVGYEVVRLYRHGGVWDCYGARHGSFGASGKTRQDACLGYVERFRSDRH